MIRTSGTSWSTTISVSWVPVVVMTALLLGRRLPRLSRDVPDLRRTVLVFDGTVLVSHTPARFVRHRREDGVEAPVALLRLPAVSLDPLGHEVEDLRLQVDRVPPRPPAADQ